MKPRSASDTVRAVSVAALVLLVALSWLWLLAGAGTGMGTTAALVPPAAVPAVPPMAMNMPGMAMAAPAPGLAHALAIIAMWWVMMVAMMLPSAAPTILLFDRAAPRDAGVMTPWVVTGYVAAWGGFSLVAALLQVGLERGGLVGAMAMAVQSRRLAAGLLIAAGFYQLTPLKGMCLSHCRNPAAFLARHYRAGRAGALRLGLVHGAYCVGCCWMLMALLFVGGVMNLAWIGFLTLVVAAEKMLPLGRVVSFGTAGLCFAFGAWLLVA